MKSKNLNHQGKKSTIAEEASVHSSSPQKTESLIFNWHIFSEYKSQLYGLTILWIMVFHSFLVGVYFYREAGPPLDYVNTFINHGNMGCDIFLFLSGIFAFYSFAKKPSYLQYEKKRFIRLFLPVILINGIFWIYLLMTEHSILNLCLRLSLLNFWITGDQQI